MEGSQPATTHPSSATVSVPASNVSFTSAGAAGSSTKTRKVKVDGARKIWNTWTHTTTKSVEIAISRFCKVDGLKIKRKSRINDHSGKTIWWFVVHGDESKLCELENKWEQVSVQTLWELHPCYRPSSLATVTDSEPQQSEAILDHNIVEPAANTTVIPIDAHANTSITNTGDTHKTAHENPSASTSTLNTGDTHEIDTDGPLPELGKSADKPLNVNGDTDHNIFLP